MKLKMWNKIDIIDIHKGAFESLRKNFNGNDEGRAYLIFILGIPSVISTILICNNLLLDKDIVTYFATIISIFAGLFFGLLFVITDKFSSRKRELTNNLTIKISELPEESKNYLKRYKNFSNFTIKQISYVIILSLIILILLSLILLSGYIQRFENECIMKILHIAKYAINWICYYLLIQLILFIMVIIKGMHIMLLDDLKL